MKDKIYFYGMFLMLFLFGIIIIVISNNCYNKDIVYQYGTNKGDIGSADLCFTKNGKHYCEIIKEVDWFAYYEETEK